MNNATRVLQISRRLEVRRSLSHRSFCRSLSTSRQGYVETESSWSKAGDFLKREMRIWLGIAVVGSILGAGYYYGYRQPKPNQVHKLIKQANTYKAQGDLKDAIRTLTEAEKIVENSNFDARSQGLVHLLLGQYCSENQEVKRAETAFSKAIKRFDLANLAPEDMEYKKMRIVALNEVAYIAQQNEEFDRAERYYIKALGTCLEPKEFEELFIYARRDSTEDNDDLSRLNHIVQRLKPCAYETAATLNNLAGLYIMMSKPHAAEAVLNRCLHLMRLLKLDLDHLSEYESTLKLFDEIKGAD